MNYLALCRRLRQECGISGTGPVAVTNQTGEAQRIVDWIASAYTELQNGHTNPPWRWMRRAFSLNTAADDGAYAYADATDVDAGTLISRFKRWHAEDPDLPITVYQQSIGVSGERDLIYLAWNDFRRVYRRGTQTSGPPIFASVDDQNNLVLGPKPDAVYVVQGYFVRGAQTLAADADTPEMPEDFHMLIVYGAMKKYAGYESAQEVYSIAEVESAPLMWRLESDQLPLVGIGPPLI